MVWWEIDLCVIICLILRKVGFSPKCASTLTLVSMKEEIANWTSKSEKLNNFVLMAIRDL